MPIEHGREPDIDALFDEIVARWDEPAADRGRTASPTPAPRAPSRPGAAATPGEAVAPSGTHVPRVPASGSPQQHFGFRGYTVPDEDDDFVPPAPRPVPAPSADPQFWGVVGCLVVGPLLVLGVLLSGRPSGTLLTIGVVLTLGGLALAVARGGRHPRDPDDDGARV